MGKTDIPDVTIRNAEIQYPNFEGRATMYKEAGTRTFRLILPEGLADKMAEDGWDVKLTTPRRDADPEERERFEPRPFINVALGYKYENKRPEVYLVTQKLRTLLGESTVFLVDQADIVKIDLTINPSSWTVGEKSGIKAYLKEAYITINESDLAQEYNHIPLADTTNIPVD